MSWLAVAEKDIRDATRSWAIWLLVGLLLLLFVGFTVLDARYGDGSWSGFLDGIILISLLFLPLIAILLGYKSVVQERVNGSLVLLLSFPHSRKDLVIGKFLGRGAVLLVPILLVLSGIGLLSLFLFDGTSPLEYTWFLIVVSLYGLSFLGIALGLSLSTVFERRVTLGAFGAYLLLVMLWNEIVTVVVLILYRFDFEILADPPDWSLFVQLLQPGESFERLLRVGVETDRGLLYTFGDPPWFVDWWVALLILLLWIVLPIAIGYRRFSQSDL